MPPPCLASVLPSLGVTSRIVLVVCAAVIAAACSPSTAGTTTSTFAPLVTSTTSAGASTTSEATTTTSTTTTTLPPNECDPEPVSGVDEAGIFAQGCTVLGIDVVASAEVDPAALEAAAERFHGMLAALPAYVDHLLGAGIRIAVIGAEERITDLPPFADLYELYPGTDWRRAGRSFAATDLLPWVAGAEENLLCSEDDRYEGEDMFVRELARTIRDFPIGSLDPAVDSTIEQIYSRAVIVAGLWDETLAENNSDTYWMEGVQSYFDGNVEADPADGEHNAVDTRDELRSYDPVLAATIESVFGDGPWRSPCG